jgi:redox-sensitive bicupin YhaK (pirin superfamily)
MQDTLQALPARDTELGTIKIRRALPNRQRRLVGPWCFFDRFGPMQFSDGKPMDVAPHPHIGLQTVTWLFEGEVVHHDSLDCEALIRPGQLNLMTAGSGIAHAEETPGKNTGTLSGLQLWVALPDAHRHRAASFNHHPDLPQVSLPGGDATVIMGEVAGRRSTAQTFWPMIGLELTVHPAARLSLQLDPTFEHALMVSNGQVELEGQILDLDVLYYAGTNRHEIELDSAGGARVVIIGGLPFTEPILMWWNFVARTNEEMDAARRDWEEHRRFGDVKKYDGPRTPAPSFQPMRLKTQGG